MADTAAEKVLSRKASAARRAVEAHGMSVEKAFRRALARTAEEAWNLALIARNARQARRDQDETAALLDSGEMILLLDGPDEMTGFALLDRQTVTALVEVQTLGLVTDLDPDDRRLTPTDAAISAPLVDGALERLADYLVDDPAGAQVAGYAFGAMIDSARIASNLLTAPSYRVFEAELELAGGLRRGRIALLLPERAPARRSAPAAGPARHEDLMLTLPARVDVVLARVKMSFAAACELAPGSLIPLPAEALTGAEIVAGGRHRVLTGTLGQMNGQRAFRVGERTGAGTSETAPGTAEHGPDRAADASAHDPAAPPPAAMDWPTDEIAAGPSPEPATATPSVAMDLPDFPDLPPLDFDEATVADEDADPLAGFASPLDDLDLPQD
ncbi:surface presentation of antigens (SPOA) protein [Roseivivax marinus]|uniref:Surface presentation of antigens (SPOA) protein n=1 Tax=Roseivivax marinus TaxID=1379903 RepID=W4HH57_9RHOB|nr:FliM/FliN family flagellar motor C-terminal domain-containing protein [Roseivivax marinus]ETW11738.1 surface presentation of antigens (SPOA) protein [Roseivivax marinus]